MRRGHVVFMPADVGGGENRHGHGAGPAYAAGKKKAVTAIALGCIRVNDLPLLRDPTGAEFKNFAPVSLVRPALS